MVGFKLYFIFIISVTDCLSSLRPILEKLVDEVARLKSDITEVKEILRDQRSVADGEATLNLPKLPIETLEEFLLLEEYTKVPQQANALVNTLII